MQLYQPLQVSEASSSKKSKGSKSIYLLSRHGLHIPWAYTQEAVLLAVSPLSSAQDIQ